MDVESCGETVHDINVLTVVASESYKTFVTDLQSDIKTVLYDRPTVATSEYFKGKYIKVDDVPTLIDDETANAIEFYLIQNGYVDMKRKVTDKYRQEYIDRFQTMAKAVAACQQPEGYWTRSLLDPEHAPGPETSGTAFFTYGLLWGMNNGLLDKATYQPVVEKAWKYLTTVALQPDGRIGYVQPIGEKAIPGQVVDANSTANFGVGAFLLAACEMVRFLD